jgi:hypothetical protein
MPGGDVGVQPGNEVVGEGRSVAADDERRLVQRQALIPLRREAASSARGTPDEIA